MNLEHRTALPLASSAGCSCCSPASHAPKATAAAAHSPAANGRREFALEGLTCGHCVRTVERAVAALDGVESVSVDLVPGGQSRLTVAGATSEEAVRTAVTTAGYSLAAR